MYSGWRRIGIPTGVIWLAAIAIVVVIGCKGGSPFAAMNFIDDFVGVPPAQGGGTLPTDGEDEEQINTVCDLEPARRSIAIALFNESRQWVNYSMTFLVSAGPGGFVCEEEEAVYRRAGYVPLQLDNSFGRPTAIIGCDAVTLLSGSRMLGLTISNVISQNPSGEQDSAVIAQPPLNGGTLIPVPELIVLGETDPLFICNGSNLCTQRGFVYTDIANNPISFITAARTQDTVCNLTAGTAPEWRLGDPNTPSIELLGYEFAAGGFIGITVLDRANNANPNDNQVIWEVTDETGVTIRPPRR